MTSNELLVLLNFDTNKQNFRANIQPKITSVEPHFIKFYQFREFVTL